MYHRVRQQFVIPCALGFALGGCAPAPSKPVPPTVERAAVDNVPTFEKLHNEPLQARVAAAIEQVRRRDLVITNAFWTIFHGILAFGPGITLLDPQTGERVNALDYILAGDFSRGEIRGLRFIPTKDGLDVELSPAMTFVGQGHRDQFIAKLAQWDIPIDREVLVHGKRYTIADFVREMQAHTRLGTELSWTIVAVGYYVGTDAKWTNNIGQEISFEDLVREELAASIDDAACGGTHRMHGLTWSYHLHLRRGGRAGGVWKELAEKIARYQALAKEYQNPDGSFSTNYFRGPGSEPGIQERLGSSGHIFEWLATSLSTAELREPWMERAADTLAKMLLEAQSQPVESGALYHAVHGLILYYTRVLGPLPATFNQKAARPKADTQRTKPSA